MQQGSIILTKKAQECAKEKKRRRDRQAKPAFGMEKIVPLNEVNLFDMTSADEVELQPLPASGAEIVALIKLYNVKETKTAANLSEKIEIVSNSEYAEKYILINAVENDPILRHE